MVASVGRPRDAGIRVALLGAAEELILRDGVGAVSVEAVSARAGTTRAAFYRRFPGIPALILALITERFSTRLDVEIDFGSLPADLDAVQRRQVAVFADPLISRGLGGFMEAVQSDHHLRSAFIEEFLVPRRAALGAILQRAITRGEIQECRDPEWICDLLYGPLFLRSMIPGLQPLDDSLISKTVASALSALEYRGG